MRLRITARGVDPHGFRHAGLEERLRLLLGSWTSRIRRARVCIEDVNDANGGLGVRCAITAFLIPSGSVMVHAPGTDVESALRTAARRLLRQVKGEARRGRIAASGAGRTIGRSADPGV